MGNLKDKATAYRKIIEDAMKNATDETALLAVDLFPVWDGAGITYAVGERVRYAGTLYKVIQAHVSQDGWTPSAAVSLFARVDSPAEEWPEWVQPTGATDAYAKGTRVSYNGKHYESTVDANAWAPGVYGWNEVTA